MKSLLLIAIPFIVVGCSRSEAPPDVDHGQHEGGDHLSHAGHQNGMLIVKTKPAVAGAGQPVALELMIHGADDTMVREFDVTHEKLVHLIMIREGLDEFAHVHPAVDEQGNLTISHTFSKAGMYRLYADYKPKDNTATIATAQIEVTGERSPAPPLVSNAPGKVTADGLVANLELSDAKGGKEAEVRFRLASESGQPIDNLEPYLGARGHLVVISANGDQYVHAHPIDSTTASNEVAFRVHFPAAGMYKGWGQFQIAGQVHTIPFVVETS